MGFVSEIWTWLESDRLYSRLTTNVARRPFLAKLTDLGMLRFAETVHAYFDDRANGGNGYEILWKASTQMSDLSNLIHL